MGEPIYHFGRMASFAEYAVIHESSVVAIGPETSLRTAALVGCAVTTGVGAVLNTAQVRPGSTVAVIGCGGVGLNVIQGARWPTPRGSSRWTSASESWSSPERFGATDMVDAPRGESGAGDPAN